MAGKRRSMKRKSTSRRTKRRGGDWFSDLGAKIKNEFVNPQSLLRQSGGIVDKASSALGGVPGLGQALSYAQQANQMAKQVGLGRRRGLYRRKSTKRKTRR